MKWSFLGGFPQAFVASEACVLVFWCFKIWPFVSFGEADAASAAKYKRACQTGAW